MFIMNRKLGVLILVFIALAQFLVAEDFESEIDENEKKIAEYMKKANPAKDFTYDLDFSNTGIIILEYIGKASEVVIPCIIDNLPVTEVWEHAFAGSYDDNKGITSIIFPDSIHTIGEECCGNLDLLQEVILPKNLKKIPKSMFFSCDSLKTIVIPDTVEIIENCAFLGSGIENIDIPDSVIIIGYGTFSGCSNLKTASIGSGIKQIWEEAFNNCSNLVTVNINVEYLSTDDHYYNGETYYGGYGKNVFLGCYGLSAKTKYKIRKTGYKDDFDYKL